MEHIDRINFHSIEKKVAKNFYHSRIFTEKIQKYYCLEMFPYPSGKYTWGTLEIIQLAM